MTTGSRIARRPVAAVRRGSTWIDTVLDTDIVTGGEDLVDLMAGMDTDERRGMTVTRMLLCLYVIANPHGAVDGVQVVDLGIGVASTEAFAAGVVSNPNVNTEFPIRGWLYRCRHVVIDDSTPGYPSPVIKEDLHAMRKIDTGTAFLVIVNTPNQGTTFTVSVIGTIRMLVKLP